VPLHLVEEIEQPAEVELPRSQSQIAPTRFAHAGDVHVRALQQVENRLALPRAVDVRIDRRTKQEAPGPAGRTCAQAGRLEVQFHAGDASTAVFRKSRRVCIPVRRSKTCCSRVLLPPVQ
jgi:hypothetical protein